jgi:hypothetical protein
MPILFLGKELTLSHHASVMSFITQYGSVKAESVGDDMKTGSFDLYSSTSVFWFF